MKTVYICEPYGVLHRSLDSLVLRRAGYKIASIPLHNVSVVVIFGTIQITTQVFQYLFDSGIDLLFMTYHGKILGRIQSEKSSNVILRIAQFKAWQNNDKRIQYAGNIIKAKISNQKYIINKYVRYKSSLREELKSKISELNASINNICNASSLNEIMGIEGSCAKKYFQCFSVFLKDYDFPGRQQHPGWEPVNALLNLGYAFLAHEIQRRLITYSFDTELGFIHGIRYGRSSLVLDLMEEFRSVFIDAFIIKLLNKKLLNRENFELHDDGCRLKTSALKKFCVLYQNHLEERTHSITWETVFNKQINLFRNSLLNGEVYEPFQA